ncbi:hypothetical protein SH2C18_25210 [Clostridium sediminicola]|uniref:hypothetical protein n=1 Tax=Clostridium sediminicola TaxID=3114879 RepID=UPI0031F230C0
MQLLVMVLNDVNKIDDLLLEFSKSNINGATVIDSHGMATVLYETHKDIALFGSLKMLLNEKRPFNKTIFTILSDVKINIALKCIRKVVGDLNKPNVGIVFTVPVNHVEGIKE